MREEYPGQEIIHAAITVLNKEGMRLSAHIMGEVLASPDQPKKLEKAMKTKAISVFNFVEIINLWYF